MNHIKAAINYLQTNKTLQDLKSTDKAVIISEYLVEAPEDFGEFQDGLSKETIQTMMHSISENDYGTAGLVLAVGLANTPYASDVLAKIEEKARYHMIEPGTVNDYAEEHAQADAMGCVMSDNRTKPCGAESCCYCDDKKAHNELLDALEGIVNGLDNSGTVYVGKIKKARALIAKHRGVE